MVDRIQITRQTYMQLDGQWQIVYPGSVVDVPAAHTFTGAAVPLAEAAGALASHGKPTPVRNIRTR